MFKRNLNMAQVACLDLNINYNENNYIIKGMKKKQNTAQFRIHLTETNSIKILKQIFTTALFDTQNK